MGRTTFTCMLEYIRPLTGKETNMEWPIGSLAKGTIPRTTSRRSSLVLSKFVVTLDSNMPPRRMPGGYMLTSPVALLTCHRIHHTLARAMVSTTNLHTANLIMVSLITVSHTVSPITSRVTNKRLLPKRLPGRPCLSFSGSLKRLAVLLCRCLSGGPYLFFT